MTEIDQKERRKRAIRRHVRDILLMTFVFGPLTVFLACTGCFSNGIEMAVASSIHSALTWIFLWKGNELGPRWFDPILPWTKNPLRRLLASLAYTVIYTTLAVGILNYNFFVLYLGRDFSDSFFGFFRPNWIFTMTITFIISTFMHGRGFFFSWRQAAIDVERLKREQLTSKYESLKKQIDPHFLFNSLNTLSSLVHKDPELSEKFIKELSRVYRYVLDSQEQEVVDLKEEWEFVEAFVFLQKIRHGDSLVVDMNVPADAMNKQLPPFALQMLIENAIKHNIVSESRPLHISISQKDDYLVVENNFQIRKNKEPSSGLGVNNIKMRYEYLSGKEVRIGPVGEKFVAEIPLLSYA